MSSRSQYNIKVSSLELHTKQIYAKSVKLLRKTKVSKNSWCKDATAATADGCQSSWPYQSGESERSSGPKRRVTQGFFSGGPQGPLLGPIPNVKRAYFFPILVHKIPNGGLTLKVNLKIHIFFNFPILCLILQE